MENIFGKGIIQLSGQFSAGYDFTLVELNRCRRLEPFTVLKPGMI